jgi:DNA polymerase-3 subunit alpha
MVDETVTVTGMVVSMRQAFTRDQRPFIVAAIEDLDASVEVIVWPRLYDSTQGLWQEGNILTVKGIVKVRDGEVQLNCQEAQRYQPPPQNRRHVIIDINQSGDAGKDIECLRKVMDILKNYPGQDKVSLTIASEDEMINLEMPKISINYCPELAGELSDILGESNLRLTRQLI